MKTSLIEIREKRARLIERAARERDDLGRGIAALSVPIAVVDRGLAVARYLKAHPVIVAAAAALVIALQPRRTISWVQRGVAMWQTWRWLAAQCR